MRLTAASALSIGALLLLGACAARSARPEHPGATAAGARTQMAESRYREMTWAEYYTDVMERARRRGVMVVWINPPPVRRAQTPAAETIDVPSSPR